MISAQPQNSGAEAVEKGPEVFLGWRFYVKSAGNFGEKYPRFHEKTPFLVRKLNLLRRY